MDDETNSQKSSSPEDSEEHSVNFDFPRVPAGVSVESIFFFYHWKKSKGPKLYRLLVESEGPVGIPYEVPKLHSIALRLRAGRTSDVGLFYNRALQLSDLDRWSLCRVVGCYSSSIDRLIIYDETSVLTLYKVLHIGGAPRVFLGWNERLKIAKCVANALSYLHANITGEEAPHGNLNSSNLIIDAYPNGTLSCVRLINYGFTSFLPNENLLQLAASRTPEVMKQSLSNLPLKIGRAADVYCMGVLFLELLTGSNPKLFDMYLVRCVMLNRMIEEGNPDGWTRGLHSPLLNDLYNHKLSMLHLLELAVQCTELKPERRNVMSVLDPIIQDIK